MKEQTRTDKVSKAQINHWKNQNPQTEVIRIWTPVSDEQLEDGKPAEVAAGYYKKPDLDVLGAVSQLGEKDKVRAIHVMFDNCWLGGDERIQTRHESKVSAVRELNKQFKVLASEVEKL